MPLPFVKIRTLLGDSSKLPWHKLIHFMKHLKKIFDCKIHVFLKSLPYDLPCESNQYKCDEFVPDLDR